MVLKNVQGYMIFDILTAFNKYRLTLDLDTKICVLCAIQQRE